MTGGPYASMYGQVNRFDWRDLDGKRGTLRVWEQESARLVLFSEDETGKTYVLSDQDLQTPG
jgi:hypothetical protein